MQSRHFENIDSEGVNLKTLVEGEGPLVILLHGFPQCWYLWRNQIDAIAESGYQVAVPDQRGYGESDAPEDITDYDILHLTSDVKNIAEKLGHQRFTVIGHDWGAAVAWNTALLHEDAVQAVAGLSVPYVRFERPEILTKQEYWGDRFWYMAYFQKPGVAELELESDIRRTLELIYFWFSGDADRSVSFEKTKESGLLEGLGDAVFPTSWLTKDDLDYYCRRFQHNGFRGPLNWYRNIERNIQETPGLRNKVVSQPAMFLAGSQDPVLAMPVGAAIDSMNRWVPNLQTNEIIKGPGHWLPMEAPTAVTEKILAFLKQTSGG